MPVGPGSLLGGRYAITGRVQQHPRWERWSARDTTLERDVVVVCFPSETAQADAALDAARRAAGVEDQRLVRVLDVGAAEGTHFVVEEPLTGAHSLRSLVEAGGLPAEEARRITGETASALAAAAARGLHHAQLTPRDVLVLPEGAIKVRGLATQAALAGEEDLPGEVASRTDVASLVGLLYAGLTGRWPLPGPDAGLEAAPRLGTGIAAPTELAAGVTADLDRLVRITLNEGGGPGTPAELAATLRPWSPVPVAEPGEAATRHTGEPTVPYPMPTPPVAPEPARPLVDGSGAAAAAAAGAATGAVRGVGEALSSAGAAASAVAGRVSSLARGAADRITERSTERAERRAYEAEVPAGEQPVDTNLTSVLVETDDGLGAPAPLLPDDLGAEPSRNESKIALAFVAALVLILAALGIWGLPRLGSGGGGGTTTPRPSAPASATPGATGGSAATGAAGSTGAAGLTPVGVVGSAGFEPSGAGQVASTTAARAFDGNPATLWRSKWYATATFGGLPVTGIGVVADLGRSVAVRRVTLTLPAAQDLTAYVATRASLAGAHPIGSATGATGQVVFDVPDGAEGTLLLVVVTKLAPDGEGHFRGQIAEIQVGA